jgi:hypothetical protein
MKDIVGDLLKYDTDVTCQGTKLLQEKAVEDQVLGY